MAKFGTLGPSRAWGSLPGMGPLCSPFPLQPAAPGYPLTPAPAPGVINGPSELIPGQLGLLEPPCHLAKGCIVPRCDLQGWSPPSAPCSQDRRACPALQGAQPCPMWNTWYQQCTGCWMLPIHLLGMKDSQNQLRLVLFLEITFYTAGKTQGPCKVLIHFPEQSREQLCPLTPARPLSLLRADPSPYTLTTGPQTGPTPIGPKVSWLGFPLCREGGRESGQITLEIRSPGKQGG